MQSTRKLVLKKEPLSELVVTDLALVVGGMSGPTCNYGACASDFQQCITADCLTERCIYTVPC